MNTLVIIAHSDLSTSTINAAWVEALRESGQVTVHALYEEYPTGQIDVAREQRILEQHHRIILQFPFRCYSSPSLLKFWLDVVLERGWAYGPGGTALQHKELGVAVSTWSTQSDYEIPGPYNRTLAELTSPFEATAKRVGMSYLPGFFLMAWAG